MKTFDELKESASTAKLNEDATSENRKIGEFFLMQLSEKMHTEYGSHEDQEYVMTNLIETIKDAVKNRKIDNSPMFSMTSNLIGEIVHEIRGQVSTKKFGV